MLSGSVFLSNHLAVSIVTARGAHMMRALTLAAIRAFHMSDRLQGVMGAAHIATRLGGFLLRNGHVRKLAAKTGNWEGRLVTEIGRSIKPDGNPGLPATFTP
jgi:hypothetical protein